MSLLIFSHSAYEGHEHLQGKGICTCFQFNILHVRQLSTKRSYVCRDYNIQHSLLIEDILAQRFPPFSKNTFWLIRTRGMNFCNLTAIHLPASSVKHLLCNLALRKMESVIAISCCCCFATDCCCNISHCCKEKLNPGRKNLLGVMLLLRKNFLIMSVLLDEGKSESYDIGLLLCSFCCELRCLGFL